MMKIRLTIATLVLSLASYLASAQVTGIQTVPGSYPTLEAAITALNTVGVGNGGATINVAAGYTETPVAPLVLTIAANPPSAANPLVIQKSGSGANPLITAPVGVGTLDGIVVLNGVDYVTFNGIDLQENAANVTTTTQMEWGYALLKTAATNGASYNTIKNSTVTLNKSNTASVGIYLGNHTTAATTALTVTATGGTSSFNKFYNNSVTNSYVGISITGFASAAPFDFYDQGNEIGTDGVSTRRNQITNFGGGAVLANGVFATNQNRIKVFKTYINSNGGVNSTSTMNGISLATGTNSNVDVYNDTITLTAASPSGSTVMGINCTMGGTGSGNTVNIYNNVVDGCTYATNTSGVFRGIMAGGTASYSNIYNNKVTNNTIPGTGEFSGIYYSGSSGTLVLNVNINDNVVSGNTKSGAGGIMYMIYASASCVSMNCFNNQLFNNNASATTAGVYGYYNFAFGLNENVYNNQIYNITGGSGDVVMLHVRSGSGPTNKEVYGNTIYNIAGNTATNFAPIWIDYGTVSNIYKNNIYNITNNSLTGSVTGGVVGILVGSNNNVQTTVYNNYVSDLKTPAMSNTLAVIGIFINSPAGVVANAYYNTVYINGTSTGANFGSIALSCASAPASIDLRNNILVNVATPTGTGLTRALVRANTTLTNYALTSGYNCLYAGTPGPANLLFSDGTNNCQTIKSFKDIVGPREQSSFTTLPPFVNVATTPYDLHLQSSVATQCEGGGTTVAGITIDFDGGTRNVNTPDVGADEISGITVDIAAPNIQYTPLTNSSVAPSRVLTSFATITDPSGINTTVGTRPRIYYKKVANANTFNDNTNGTDGWKYVEASNTSSPFGFTINYSLLFGGGGVIAGDVIQYFVVAQDLNGTPIVGLNNGGFTVQPSSVILAAANFPLNNTINQYTIVNAALTGTVNVGPTELVTSLTNAGGIFNIINASSLSGNLTINITGDLTAETGTFALNQWAEEGVGGYTVTIQSSAAITRNIYGSSAAAALIRFDGADRVTVNGGTNYLMFRNTSNTAPTIGFSNDAQNNTVTGCIIESGNTATSTTLGGAILIGTTTGPNGNDNITISNCEIRDRSDLPATPAIGILCAGTTTTLAQYNNNCSFTNNNIHDWFLLNSASQFGLYVGVGNSGFTITGNSLYQTVTRTNTVNGAVVRCIIITNTAPVNSNGGFTVSGNYIGGTAPLATGGDMTYSGSTGVTHTFGAISVTSGLIPNSIQGNIIRKIDYTTTSPSANATMWFGINLGQGVHNVGTTTGNTVGDGASTGSIKITINSGGTASAFLAGVLASTINGSYTIQNNTIGGITIAGTSTTTIIPQWIQVQGTPAAPTTISNNTIGSTTVPNSIQNNAVTTPLLTFAIRYLVSTGVGATITGNTIQSITDNSTSATSTNYGILLISASGSSGTLNVSNNTIKDLTVASSPAGAVLGNMGMSFQGYGGINHTVSGNVISGINATNTGAFSNYCVGIQTQGNSMGGTMSKNQIFDLRNVNTGAPGISGIYISAGLNWTFTNNMISLSNANFTNAIDVTGISDVMGANTTGNYYYNSIYVGGSAATGASNAFSYIRYGTANVTLRDNILYNRRSGGTGVYGAISNGSAVVTGWPASASNYNALIVADTSKVATWGVPTYNIAGWRAISGGDLNSISDPSANVPTAALFVSVNTGNLHINTSTYPEALGTPVAGVTVDFDNNPRSATFPTIGADELACSNIVFTVSTQTNVSCNGGNNGAATVGGTGGNGLTYSWAPAGGNAATATGLSAGTYTCTISNICGNTGSVVVTITQPSVVTATSVSTNVTCNGNGNGSATVSPSGGTGPYTYAWSPSGGTAATASGLAVGSYTCVITDANSCTTSQSVTITEPTLLVASATGQTDVSCNGGTNGTASVTASGGTAAYSFAWTPAGGNAAAASGLGVGSYTCTVTDANGCTATQSFAITEPTALAATSMQTDLTCNGGNNGDAMVMVSGGTASYSYAWSPSGGNASSASNLTAGTYTCLVTDANGCTLTQTFNLTQPSPITATTGQANVTCNGGNDGSGFVTASGGTGSYTYSWSPSGGSAALASGLTAGTYSCLITDANSCTYTQTFNITEPAVVAATVTTANNPTSCGGSDGSIDITVSGGTPAYTFVWNTTASTEDLSGLTAGSYSVTITDINGCSTTANASLNDPNAPVVTLALTIDSVCQSTTSPFTLAGESPAGGTFSGPGVSGGIFTPLNAAIGMNVISYTYTDSATGCTASTTDSIYVDICLGVMPGASNGNFEVYPNPNNGTFNLVLNTNEAAEVQVYDAVGQLVSTQMVQPKVQQTIHIEVSGAYMISVVTADGQRTTQRVIVTR